QTRLVDALVTRVERLVAGPVASFLLGVVEGELAGAVASRDVADAYVRRLVAVAEQHDLAALDAAAVASAVAANSPPQRALDDVTRCVAALLAPHAQAQAQAHARARAALESSVRERVLASSTSRRRLT